MVTIGGSGNREARDGPKPMLDEKNNKEQHNTNSNQKPNNKPSHTKNAKNSFDSLPDLFLANIDQAGKCVTIEGEPVHFPKPGPKLLGKAEGPGYKCSEQAPFLRSASKSTGTSSSKSETKSEAKPTSSTSSTTSESETKPTTTSASSTDSEKKSSATSTSSSAATKEASKIAKVFGTPSVAADARVLSTEASTNNQFINYVGRWPCHSGDIICSPDGLSFAMCTHGKPVFMGPVAAGTICRGGVITARY